MDKETKAEFKLWGRVLFRAVFLRKTFCPQCGKFFRFKNAYAADSHGFIVDTPDKRSFWDKIEPLACCRQCAELAYADMILSKSPDEKQTSGRQIDPLLREIWNSLHFVSINTRNETLRRLFGKFTKEQLLERVGLRKRLGLPKKWECLLKDARGEDFGNELNRKSPATLLALQLLYGVDPHELDGEDWDLRTRFCWETADTRGHSWQETRLAEAMSSLYGKETEEFRKAMAPFLNEEKQDDEEIIGANE